VKRSNLLPKSDGKRLRRRQRDGGIEAQKQSTQTKQTKKGVRSQKKLMLTKLESLRLRKKKGFEESVSGGVREVPRV